MLKNPSKKLFSLLSKNKTVEATFAGGNQESAETHILRFLLPDPDLPLGVPTGQYIQLAMDLNGERKSKFFHPISSDDQKGYVDLLVKDFSVQTPQYGQFSHKLATLQEGDTVEIEGPIGETYYKGDKVFVNKGKEIKVDKLGLIASHVGIAPAYCLLSKILAEKSKIGLSLLYFSKKVVLL